MPHLSTTVSLLYKTRGNSIRSAWFKLHVPTRIQNFHYTPINRKSTVKQMTQIRSKGPHHCSGVVSNQMTLLSKSKPHLHHFPGMAGAGISNVISEKVPVKKTPTTNNVALMMNFLQNKTG